MAEQSSGLGEAVDVGTSAASHLQAMKTAAHLSKTVAGAAAGPFTQPSVLPSQTGILF